MKITLDIEGVDTVDLTALVGRVLDHLSEQERERAKQYEYRRRHEEEVELRKRRETDEEARRREEILQTILQSIERVVQTYFAKSYEPQVVHGGTDSFTSDEPPVVRPVWWSEEADTRIAKAVLSDDAGVIFEEFVKAFKFAKEALVVTGAEHVESFVADFLRVYGLANATVWFYPHLRTVGGLKEALDRVGPLSEEDIGLLKSVVDAWGLDDHWEYQGEPKVGT